LLLSLSLLSLLSLPPPLLPLPPLLLPPPPPLLLPPPPPLLLPPPPPLPLLLLQPVTPLLFPLPALLLRRKLMEDVVNLPDYSNQTRLDMTTRNCAQTVIQGTLDLGKVGGEWVGARNKPAMWHCPEAS
jgi:hypothetical protein